jgi:TRAP-type mannitol/chloroaromatic compound transport system permease small subunit
MAGKIGEKAMDGTAIEQKSSLNRFMEVMSVLDEKIAELSGWVVVVMMLTISYDVVMRYFFNAPTTWSFEINRYMLIMVVFLGSGWTLPAGGHVSVDIATEMFSHRKQQVLIIFSHVIAGGYALVFFIESVAFTLDAWENGVRSTEYLAWPLWPIRFFLVIGAGMLFLECIFKIIRTLTEMRPKA